MQEKKVEYYANGNIRSEIWVNTLLNAQTIHRNDGPAWVFYNIDGEIIEREWFWHGTIMSCSQWLEVSDGPKEALIQIKLTNGGDNDAEKNVN